MNKLDCLALKYKALEKVDKNEFQRRARILQSLWRIEKEYGVGLHRGRSLGSRLEMPWAKETLSNFLTCATRKIIYREVLSPDRDTSKLYQAQIFYNLLSSQAFCFNLFGDLSNNFQLLKEVFQKLLCAEIAEICDTEFEYSPGRRNPCYTGDKTAFDFFVTYRKPNGRCGFIGIETKYHEKMTETDPTHTPRHDEIAQDMGCFREENYHLFDTRKLNENWRNHLLAGVLLQKKLFDEGCYIFMYPKDNEACESALHKYRNCLTDSDIFSAMTLEHVVETIKNHTSDSWIHEFWDRYLNFDKIEKEMHNI